MYIIYIYAQRGYFILLLMYIIILFETIFFFFYINWLNWNSSKGVVQVDGLKKSVTNKTAKICWIFNDTHMSYKTKIESYIFLFLLIKNTYMLPKICSSFVFTNGKIHVIECWNTEKLLSDKKTSRRFFDPSNFGIIRKLSTISIT